MKGKCAKTCNAARKDGRRGRIRLHRRRRRTMSHTIACIRVLKCKTKKHKFHRQYMQCCAQLRQLRALAFGKRSVFHRPGRWGRRTINEFEGSANRSAHTQMHAFHVRINEKMWRAVRNFPHYPFVFFLYSSSTAITATYRALLALLSNLIFIFFSATSVFSELAKCALHRVLAPWTPVASRPR